MRAGELDRRIKIEENFPTKDSHGDDVDDFKELVTVWAEKRPMQGSERFQSQQILAQADFRFLIRHRTDVTPKMRIILDGESYNIEAVTEIGRKQGTQIFAKLNQA